MIHKNTIFITSPLIKRAVYFAAQKHDRQYRKGTDVPYFAHPVLVTLGVLQYSSDENILAAAMLHDVLEDCAITYAELKKLFGGKVANLVKEVSFPDTTHHKDITWKNKKTTYIHHIKKASKDALVIVAIDKMNNMQGYFESVIINKNGLSGFGGTPENYFWYYEEIYKILKANLNSHVIVKKYHNLLQYYKIKLQ
jgi:(p)ppGpp synthase/HD superfamily hydrolase